MTSNIADDKLDAYISKIKTTSNSANRVLNYKKAVGRLSELKTEYNNLCAVLKNKAESESDDSDDKKKKSKKRDDDKINIDSIMVELNHINTEIDKGTEDVKDLISKYIQYKSLLAEMDIASEKIKNEIYKVDESKNKITIHKLSLEDLA